MQRSDKTEAPSVTVPEALADLLLNPKQRLLRLWNWKAALLSACVRGTVFFCVNIGARMMIPLQTMQEALGAAGMCSMFLVKCERPEEQEEVARRLVARLPDSRIIFTRDLPVLFAHGFAAFNVFLEAVAALAMTISLLIILLTTYTTVTERTRQIGILKALGASKRFIAMVFIKESLLVSAMGVAGGLLIALIARPALAAWAGLNIEIEAGYTLCATLGGLASGLIGAIYPALRAAGQDAVEALSYE